MEENKKTREIDVIGLLQNLLLKWRFIFKVVVVTTIIGVVVALSSQKQYTAEVVLAPEISSGGLGLSESLSDMAASFGIDIGGKSQMDALYPEIYPSIFASTDFIISLFNIPVQQEKDSVPKTYHDHLLVDSATPFWKYPVVLLNLLFSKKESAGASFNPFKLSRTDEALVEAIRGTISCQIDKKTSIITLQVTDVDRQVAAIMADTLLQRLQNYIIDYRTSKARNDLNYFEQLRNECQAEYQECQRRYSAYCDSHLNSKFQSTNQKIDELERDMELKYQAYSQMEQQVRTTKARVQERTPAFTIIQNATIPNKASSTPRSLIVVLYLFFGIIGASFWVLFGKDVREMAAQLRK